MAGPYENFKNISSELSEITETKTDEKIIKAKQKLGYLSGYLTEEESTTGKKVIGYEESGKPIYGDAYAQSNQIEDTSIMQTIDESSFKYHNFDNDFTFEDPTFFGFELLFEVDSSPLFNYGDNINGQLNSAKDFINKYSNISEIASREQIYNKFLEELGKIFDTTEKDNQLSKNKSYYIETITGLEKLTAKMTKYGEDLITVSLTEDISLRASYLAELYNNLVYSYKNQRYLIPDNCLRFDLKIKITDIRSFKIPNPNYDNTITDKSDIRSYSEIKNENPAYIIYKLHDCNFDFFNSIAFDAGLTVAGFGAIDSNAKNLEFNIKYKSISKEFSTPLIKDSLFISNKRTTIVNAKTLNSNVLFHNQISNETLVTENFKSDDRSKRLSSTGFKLEEDLDYNPEDLTTNLRKTLEINVDDYKDKLLDKFENIRGSLLSDIKKQIRTTINIQEIYPSNVYDQDFRKLSIENFSRGLFSDLSNDLEGSLDNFLNI